MMEVVYYHHRLTYFSQNTAEGSSNNKYFEIYNPTVDTVDLTNYARVNSSSTNYNGVYEFWVDFDSGLLYYLMMYLL